ncbi:MULTISPECIES: DUF6644 family protein [unclassified Novosphingobium]|uniref:DUF6644 family protein n=1 Tax=Novosphingobium TaxID=165696 RepID=UPI00146EEF39|nr:MULTISPECIES: DUF6644 family protein [unclassified Novosphingobium]NMN04578.1 putative membrane protein [Novosphingobium sp. SG919]NMN85429.1 putative membrane protein [Novosphingobium sp. SG916]
MSVEQFASNLYSSELSTSIREATWIIPTVQSIHIIAIAGVVGSAIVMDLRLAGVLATDETPQAVVRRHLPWMWTSLAILLCSGLVLGMAEPYRVLTNTAFWAKMALVLTGFVLTLLFRYPILHPEYRAEHARAAALVKPLAWASLAIWIVVIFCGRWIAYL